MVAEAMLRVYIPAPEVRFTVYPDNRQEIEDEQRWAESFANSQDALAKLAERARKNYLAGKTDLLDPDAL